jgi:hypothetical protein
VFDCYNAGVEVAPVLGFTGPCSGHLEHQGLRGLQGQVISPIWR